MISSSRVSTSRKTLTDFKYYIYKKTSPEGISASVFNCVKCQKCGTLCLDDMVYDTEFKNPGDNTFTFLETVGDSLTSAGLTKIKQIPGSCSKIDGKCLCEKCQE